MLKKYNLILLNNLDKESQSKVLNIRNEENVRKWMFTENEIKTNEHFAWIEKLKSDETQIYYIIQDENLQPIGAISLKKIDKINKSAEIGFFKTLNYTEKGLMTDVLYEIIDYSFNVLMLEKIYSEAIEGNQKSYNIHKRLQFTEEGFLRSHIIKEEKRMGIHLFGLLKEEWNNKKNKIEVRNDICLNI